MRASRRAARSALGRARGRVIAVGALAFAAIAVWVVGRDGRELGHASALVLHPAFGWVAVAVLCELVSFLAYAGGQKRLVRAAGQRLSVGWLAGLAVAAQALNNFLPGGYVAANVLNFSELRHRRLGVAAAGWVLLTSSALYLGTIAALALAGTLITGERGGTSTSSIRIAALAVLGLIALVGAAGATVRRGRLGRGILAVAVRLAERAGDAGSADPEAGRARLSQISLSRAAFVSVASLFLLTWLADAACLTCGFLAVGTAPPWRLLLLGYGAAQLVSFMPITPGGVGLMEGSLTVILALQGRAGEVLAAVLIYRIVSYWATLPAGLVGYYAVRRTRPAAPAREGSHDSTQRPAAVSAVAGLTSAPDTSLEPG